MRSGLASVFCATTRSRAISVAALAIVFLGCGADPLRPDGGNPGSGGTAGRAGSGGNMGSGGDSVGASGSGGATDGGGGAGSGGVVGSGGAKGTGGTTGSGGAGGGCGKCQGSLSCCGTTCLDLDRDPLNCGACGNRCPSDKFFCEGGACKAAPCGDRIYPAPTCSNASLCCGRDCCQPNQICCNLAGPIDYAGCYTPTADKPSCPIGCGALGLCMSDRTIKGAIEPVDSRAVLDKVRDLPISTWQYLSDPADVRHMGPMAQHFRQAFGLGDSDRVYHAVDGHGVALASIQALARLAAEQQRRIAYLEHRLRTLERKQPR